MSLEKALIDHTAAILKLDATIAENTAVMKSLASGTPPMPTPRAGKKSPAPEPAAPATEEPETTGKAPEVDTTTVETAVEAPAAEAPTPAPEPEAPTPAAEAPAAEAPAADDHTQWDAAKLRLAVQEYCKTRLTSGTDEAISKFKESFTAELASLGVPKAAKLEDGQLADFYTKALTW